MKVIARDELARHASEKDGVWILIEDKVYDVTQFADEHPGGKKILLKYGGGSKDATEQFWAFHNETILRGLASQFLVGAIEGSEAAAASSTSSDGENKGESQDDEIVVTDEEASTDYFGDLVPFSDPYWYMDWASPFYNDSHKRVRAFMRKFTDRFLTPNAMLWDDQKQIPLDDFRRVASAGILAGIAGGSGWLDDEYTHGINVPGGVDPGEWDAFHNLVVVDELSRTGSGGVLWGLIGGFGIGLPPVIHFGSDELKREIVRPCLLGDKRICLAITEPSGGSDVANLTTTADKTADGEHYIVNGEKKWITNGVVADYFVTAVRTGGKGMGGISLLVIPRLEGVKTRQMHCMGVWASGTSYVTFEDVKVPSRYLLGRENKGFQLIMSNFNPERIGIAIQANRFARVCLEDSIKFASKRKAFGGTLLDQPVVRNKLAHMARKVEATHALLEQVVYQSTKYDTDTTTLRGGGIVALLKAQSTDTFEYCAREAAQIFGGLSYTRGGQGERVERLYREVRAYAIPGGSEELMLDLGIRQQHKIATIMGAKI